MTVTVTKTKAEQAFGRQFEAQASSLPGGGWVGQLRRRALGAFETLGLPSRRVEAFKYTDLRQQLDEAYPQASSDACVDTHALDRALGPLASLDADRLVLVNGLYRHDLSVGADLAPCWEFMPLGALLTKAPAWLESKFARERVGEFDALAALNTAFMRDGVMLKLKPSAWAHRPVLVVHVRAGAARVASYSRNLFAIEAEARGSIVEAFVALEGAGPGQSNTFADIAIGEGARLSHVVCRLGDGSEKDVAHTLADVSRNAEYRSVQLIAGAGLARHQAVLKVSGEGAKCEVSGVMLGRGDDHIDTTLVVDHLVAGGRSREHFKAVLDDEARGVFQGKVIVRPGAQKTDGQMMAEALMLGAEAEFDSKPELEIYADDVQCGHGSTCADLDKDQIFFCRSRGIGEAEARALLVRGFVGEIIAKVGDDALEAALLAVGDAWLKQSDGDR